MPAKVPINEIGSASAGMIVAVTLRRNRKITSTTSPIARVSVNWTSATEARIDSDRSSITSRLTEAGSCARKVGTRSLTRWTTLTVLASGWR